MRILFLGGTSFVGRHIAEAAIAADHDVIFFNRGRTNATLFPANTTLLGDREGDVDALAALDVEVVIDTSGYTPDSVRASALAVANRVRTYYFMSSVDAYAQPIARGCDESSPTKTLAEGESTSERSPELYGAQKAACERELVAILGAERVLVARAGLMVGPYDATDRFTYWPIRFSRGGTVLAPVGRDLPIQIIDVRDVADWTIAAVERSAFGIVNLVGMPDSLNLGDVLDASAAVSAVRPEIVWVPSSFLGAENVDPWVELPLWIPDEAELRRFCSIRNDRARASGLRIRPLAETIRDISAEHATRPNDRAFKAGLTPERERALLAAWPNS